MGFFWYYDTPYLEQELRFIQQVQFRKEIGYSIMHHRWALEQQISQAIETGDDYHTRWRYQVGFTFPTASPFYFGFQDEIFGHLGDTDRPAITENRLIGFLGWEISHLLKLEGRVMMEDQLLSGGNSGKSWVLGVSAFQVF